MTTNTYDPADNVRRLSVIIAGPMKIAEYVVRDPNTGEFGPSQFHMTYDNMVLAMMGKSAAKLFADFVQRATGNEPFVYNREQELLEANNRYLQRARDAEAALALLQQHNPVKVAP